MILNLLQGVSHKSERFLATLREELGENPSMLWYPSAGIDFRDTVEYSSLTQNFQGTSTQPILYVHTDYAIRQDMLPPGTIVYHTAEGATLLPTEAPLLDFEVTIVESHTFQLRPSASVCYSINSSYIDSPERANSQPSIWMLKVGIRQQERHHSAYVLYFAFENFNFLEQILLKQQLRVEALLKVREGIWNGGALKSITTAYGLLSCLQVAHLICDDEEQLDPTLLSTICEQNKLVPREAKISKEHSIKPLWSGMNVRRFKVTYQPHNQSQQSLSQLLQKVGFIDTEAYK